VARKDALADIADSAGLEAVYAAVEAHKLHLTSQLLTMTPEDSASKYADLIGRLKALEEFPLIVQGIIEHGREAELALREQTD
jgi:hypothetical protein